MVRSLLSLQLSRSLFNRLPVDTHVVVATRSLSIANDGTRTRCLHRLSELLVSELKVMALQIIFHLCVILDIVGPGRAIIWIAKLIGHLS